jgi:hypothetical protein
LQLFFADLHSDVPLQEFTPVHLTVAASAANDVVAIPEVNSMAAAAATAALDSLLICILEFLNSYGTQRNCCSYKRPGQRQHYYPII